MCGVTREGRAHKEGSGELREREKSEGEKESERVSHRKGRGEMRVGRGTTQKQVAPQGTQNKAQKHTKQNIQPKVTIYENNLQFCKKPGRVVTLGVPRLLKVIRTKSQVCASFVKKRDFPCSLV